LKRVIVAIDGPSGAGKSTVAKLLASKLGYVYIDTGAMYRAIGWKARQEGVEPTEGPELQTMLRSTEVTLRPDGDLLRVYVDGTDVTGLIRTPEMSMAASKVSAQPSVRARLLDLQRGMGKGGGVVLEGRDIGTVVFPGAEAKFFLVAAPEVRARRRYEELLAKGEQVDYESTLKDVMKRDHDDESREIAPLAKAPDALTVDTTGMGIDEVVGLLVARVEEAARGPEASPWR